MFALTKKTDYAIIALCHMAQRPGSVLTAREIAGHFNVPLALLMNVLKVMNQKELVRSIRGAKGGYVLAVAPHRITLADIIDAVEGPIRVVQCAAGREAPPEGCGLAPACPVTKPVNRVHDKLHDFLKNVTLAQIAFDEEYGDPHRECLRLASAASSEPIP
jgi:Rrf2 family protein